MARAKGFRAVVDLVFGLNGLGSVVGLVGLRVIWLGLCFGLGQCLGLNKVGFGLDLGC